ncbi:uroporphyrinogen decarboxylase [Actinomadura darangshiensis]|uniref:Uroporphyrinogen decarboxylase n=1 Tax=Actinomadura darangshiensis TaxID=705336 RepID=A0A4R5BU36_9ACTN|nr:uroporphyrinogen decarboxylase [Actinomadura darangshiensis]TDD89625.1 uroporphyrinogen decarboxylase [Actinomadura darangshiensis]
MTSELTRPGTAPVAPDAALLLRAVRGIRTSRPPVWLMRQAGQYLPEHRELRERHGLKAMLEDPELTATATLQPLARFPLDAALLFADIMSPVTAMGVPVEFTPGPIIQDPVRTAAAIGRLRLPEPEEITPAAVAALRMVRDRTALPIIGFCGGPLTLATYLVQGYARGEQADFRGWLHAEPGLAHRLLELLTEVALRQVCEQVAAGADVIQIYDSWAGILEQQAYTEFGLPYLNRLLAALGELEVPRVYLATCAAHLYPSIATLPAEVVSVDWRMPLGRSRALLGGKTLQGNLDPAALLGGAGQARAKTLRVLRDGAGGPHIFNLGHSILPRTPVDAVAAVVDTVAGFTQPN